MAKIMQGECNGKMWKRSFTKLDTAEPPLVLCKDNANERKESLLLISRVPLVLCKDIKKNVKMFCNINYFTSLVKPLVICDVILSKSFTDDRNEYLQNLY